MMGDDITDDEDSGMAPVHPATQHAVHHAICAQLMAHGLTPGGAVGAGCLVCGVLDASPARCEFCAHGVGFERPAWLDTQPAVHRFAVDADMASTHRPAAVDAAAAVPIGAEPDCVRQRACRCGADGCADGACPGRPA